MNEACNSIPALDTVHLYANSTPALQDLQPQHVLPVRVFPAAHLSLTAQRISNIFLDGGGRAQKCNHLL